MSEGYPFAASHSELRSFELNVPSSPSPRQNEIAALKKALSGALQVADAEKSARLSAEDKAAAETKARQVLAVESSSSRARLLEQNLLKEATLAQMSDQLRELQQLLSSETATKEAEILGRKTAEGELTKERLNVLTIGRHLSTEAERREASERNLESMVSDLQAVEQSLAQEEARSLAAETAFEEAVTSQKDYQKQSRLAEEALGMECQTVQEQLDAERSAREAAERMHAQAMATAATLGNDAEALQQALVHEGMNVGLLQSQAQHAENVVEALAARCQQLERECTEVKQELDQERKKSSAVKQVLESENSTLTHQLSGMARLQEQRAELNAQNAQLHEQHVQQTAAVRLIEEKLCVRDQQLRQLQLREVSMDQQIGSMEATSMEQELRQVGVSSTVAPLSAELKTLQQTSIEVKALLSSKEEQMVSLLSLFEELQSKLDKSESVGAALEVQVERLGPVCEQLEDTRVRLQNSEGREGALAVALEQMGSQITQRLVEHQRLEELHQKSEQRREELELLPREVSALKQDLGQSIAREQVLRASLQELKPVTDRIELVEEELVSAGDSEAKLLNLAELNVIAEKEIKSLRQELSDQAFTLETTVMSHKAVERREEALKARLAEKSGLEAHVAELQQQLDDAGSSVELDSLALKAQVRALEHDLQLSESCEQAQKVALEQVKPLYVELELVQERDEHVEQMKTLIETLQVELSASVEREATLQLEGQQAEALAAQAELHKSDGNGSAVEALSTQLLSIQRENCMLESKMSEMVPIKELQQATERADLVEKQGGSLQHDLQLSMDSLQLTVDQLGNMSARVEELQCALDQSEQQRVVLQTEGQQAQVVLKEQHEEDLEQQLEELGKVQQEIEALQKEVQNGAQRESALQAELGELRQQNLNHCDRSSVVLKQSQLDQVALAAHLESLQHDLQFSQRREEALTVAAEQLGPLADRLDSAQNDLRNAEEREEVLKAQMEECSERGDALMNQQVELEALRQEVDLRAQRQATMQEHLEQSDKRVATLLEDLGKTQQAEAKLDAELKQSAMREASLKAHVHELEVERMGALSAKVDALQMELRHSVGSQSALEVEVQQVGLLTAHVEALQHMLDQTEAREEVLKQQVELLKPVSTKLQQVERDLMVALEQMQQLEEQLGTNHHDLQQSQASEAALKGELQQLKQSLQQSQESQAILKRELQQLGELVAQMDGLQQQLEASTEQLTDSTQREAAVKEELEQRTEQLAAAELEVQQSVVREQALDVVVQQVAPMTDLVEQLQAENREAVAKHESMTTQTEQLLAQLEVSQKKLCYQEKLQMQLQQSIGRETALQMEVQQIGPLALQVDSLQSVLELSRSQQVASSDQADNSAKLQEELAQSFEREKQQLDSHSASIRDLLHEMDALRHSEAEVPAFKLQVAAKDDEITALRAQIAAKDDGITALKAQIAVCGSEAQTVVILSSQLTEVQQEVILYKSQQDVKVGSLTTKLSKLTSELEQTRKREAMLRVELQQAEGMEAEMDTSVSDLSEQLNALQADRDRLWAELSQTKRKERARAAELKQQLEQSQVQQSQLQTSSAAALESVSVSSRSITPIPHMSRSVGASMSTVRGISSVTKNPVYQQPSVSPKDGAAGQRLEHRGLGQLASILEQHHQVSPVRQSVSPARTSPTMTALRTSLLPSMPAPNRTAAVEIRSYGSSAMHPPAMHPPTDLHQPWDCAAPEATSVVPLHRMPAHAPLGSWESSSVPQPFGAAGAYPASHFGGHGQPHAHSSFNPFASEKPAPVHDLQALENRLRELGLSREADSVKPLNSTKSMGY